MYCSAFTKSGPELITAQGKTKKIASADVVSFFKFLNSVQWYNVDIKFIFAWQEKCNECSYLNVVSL